MFNSEISVEVYQRDLCFIDIETTGARMGFHEIIDVGVIRTCPEAKNVLVEWQCRIAPLYPERITEFARELTGFSVESWTAKRPSRGFWEEFVTTVSGAVPVCHNPSFERAFISLAAEDHGISELGLDYHWIGTESLAWPLVKSRSLSRFSLESLCTYLDLRPETKPHNSLGGADACRRAYRSLMDNYFAISASVKSTSN
jgi:DNA polymerase III subunit epsilon